MAQNQPYTQYPYTPPQNIYQQLGKPQPQPHLQSAYQQQQQQQYQYSYQHPQHQPQNELQIQRTPSAHGLQPPQTPFPNASGISPQQQIAASQHQQQQQQIYHYSQPVPAPTPVPQAPAMYQRSSSQNSRLPVSSFANLTPGQPIPSILARQLGSNQQVTNSVNSTSGQLVPASQSLTLRGPSPAISPGPPISPSALFSQQVQQQRQQQYQPPSQALQGRQQSHQQTPPMSLVPANRNSIVVAQQGQFMGPSQVQPQPQHQPQVQHQTLYQTHNPPPALPPRQPVHDQQTQQLLQLQTGKAGQTKPMTARRPLPTPGAPRTSPSVNTANSAPTASISSSISNLSPTRSGNTQQLALITSTQPNSPTKTTPTSPTKAPSSPNQTSRPLPTPGSGSGRASGAGTGSGGNGLAREGFAGIGTKSSSSRITGLPVDPSVSSLVAGIEPHKLAILPLPEGSSPEKEKEDSSTMLIKTGLPNPPSLIQAGPSTSAEGSGSVSKRRVVSPPEFQPGSSAGSGATSGSGSPTKESPPSASSSGHKPSPTVPVAASQSSPHPPQASDGSPTKKFTPVWKRTIPEYPQPAFGYAAGMVKDPWAKSPPSTSTTPQTQSPGQAKPATKPAPAQPVVKPTPADSNRQRAFVERQHVERQLNAAMAQAYAQAKAQQEITGMPVSGTSYSAYAMYSKSNPDLRQLSGQHVRSGAYHYGNDDDNEGEGEEEESDSEDDDEEETEETEEEQEIRRSKQGKKTSESTINAKKKKKKSAVKDKGKEKEKEEKVAKKPKPAPRSVSAPPKKRIIRQEILSTSDDDAESAELTLEETEAEEEDHRRARHKKSSSVSSSRFKAKVEREKEALRKKRPQSQYDYPPEGCYDDEDTPRKPGQQLNRRRQSPPRRPYYQWDATSGFRQGSPSPPSTTRASRRVSPPRVSLLKDAQRRTIKLRGGDDEDEFNDRGGGRREEMERWDQDNRYRSRERFREEEYVENERRYSTDYSSPYHEDGDGDYYDSRDYRRQGEREIRYNFPRASGGQSTKTNTNGPPLPPTMARRRDTAELREYQSPRGGRRDEREYSNKMFSLGRQETPTRHPVRDSTFAADYRNRPDSPERSLPQQQKPLSGPLMSPYRSQPSSPRKKARQTSDHRDNGELITKFSAMNVKDRERNGIGRQGEWPVDLPRLPKTPGEASNTTGDYFDGPQKEDARISGRTSGGNGYESGYGSSVRSGRRDAHNPHHYNNLSMDLDDPPPRSVSPALSQGSISYGYSEQPQQPPQSFTDRRPLSQTYAPVPTDHTMQRPKSLYGSTASNPTQQPLPRARSRPQNQMYDRQVDVPQPTPSPPRPQSINPYVREEMNKTNINNGTPKVQTINIESPAPVGGREKRADLDRMMSDPEDEGFGTPIPVIDINGGFDTGSQRGDTPSQEPMIQVSSPSGQVGEPSGGPTVHARPPRGPPIQVDLPRKPTAQINSPRGPTIRIDSPGVPVIQVDTPRGPVINVDPPQVPIINVDSSPSQNVSSTPNVQVFEVPGISISGPAFDDEHDNQGPPNAHSHRQQAQQRQQARPRPAGTRGGLICGGCDGPIIGRIVSAMGSRWHPQCFKCTVCGQLLEHVSSYEHNGKPYCHLDYHENFAPRCFSCKTAIIEERFISLDDPALGKRTYHEQHFFCAECGDPFLAPSMNNSSRTGELSVQGDGEFESDDVGFTVYKGHPYCEACHVRLRLPKCKKCKKSIRDHDQAVEALGGKWCWGCFVCAGCEKPFENPSFFQRGDKPFCERCFDIMLRNEV